MSTCLRIRDVCFFFFSSRRRHTRLQGDWSSDVCSSDLLQPEPAAGDPGQSLQERLMTMHTQAAAGRWQIPSGNAARLSALVRAAVQAVVLPAVLPVVQALLLALVPVWVAVLAMGDRKSTRLNSSHLVISYAVFCLKQ